MNQLGVFSTADQYYISKPYYAKVKQLRELLLSVKTQKTGLGKKIAQLARGIPTDAMILWPKNDVYVSLVLIMTIDYQLHKIFDHLCKHGYAKDLKIDQISEENGTAFDIYFFCDYRYIPALKKLGMSVNRAHLNTNLMNAMICGNQNTLTTLLSMELVTSNELKCVFEPNNVAEMLGIQQLMLINYAKCHSEEETVDAIVVAKNNNRQIWQTLQKIQVGDVSADLWGVAFHYYDIELATILKEIRLAGMIKYTIPCPMPYTGSSEQQVVEANRSAWLRKIYSHKAYAQLIQLTTVKIEALR